jgi:precorrin-2/cobalt-factor-2 C20-methyltransferase
MAAALIGVGVGPGDPELLTTKALRVLRSATRVFGPSFALDAVGRAESIVREADPTVQVERVVVEMRRPNYDAIADRIARCLDAGERVAFITLGDPTIYSTFTSVATAVLERRPAAVVEVVPGIMAFQALAARAATVVLDGAERLCLVSAVEGPGSVDRSLADPDAAIIVYKGGRHLPEIATRLAAAGRLDGAVVGELLGMPGERIAPVKDFTNGPAAYLATVIVPPASRGVDRNRAHSPNSVQTLPEDP